VNLFLLSWKLLKRDWRAGELQVLILALIIAVTSITSIGVFTQRINLAIHEQSGDFLGADLLFSSPKPVSQSIIKKAEELGLQHSNSLLFSSVVVAHDTFQLAHVKSIDDNYPLKGKIKISPTLYGEAIEKKQGPLPGEVWLSSRLFNSLNINIGDNIELGESQLKATAVLIDDPGQTTNFITIAPRLLMHFDDIDKTGIIQPGSRVVYQQLFTGSREQRKIFEQWMKPQINPTQKLIGGKEGSSALYTALNRAEQYLSLAAMLSVMLAGVAIAMAANRYSIRHFDMSALLRCMGIQQSQLINLYTYQILLIGLLASLTGCVMGYFSQQVLIVLLRDILPSQLPPPTLEPFVIGLISGLVTLVGFSLPAILRLKSVPPLRVLRRDMLPMPVSSVFIYMFALLSIVLLMWWQSTNLALTLMVMTGVGLAVLMLGILLLILFKTSYIFSKRLHGPWRLGLQQLIRHKSNSQLQILSFSLALMVLMIILLIRTDLISRWQASIPAQAPNHFIINIQPGEVDAVRQLLIQHNIETENIFPMVRGRISKINEIPVVELTDDELLLDESLKRELNLSWATQLQTNNEITQGRWWHADDNGKPLISIEQNLAKRLNVELFDTVTFRIVDHEITAQVVSLRSVQWDSFTPNFYILFPSGIINDEPTSYITSFYLPVNNKIFINKMVKDFPGLTVIELDVIINQLKSILTQVTIAIEFVMGFVLLAGITVLLAAIQSTMDERIQNTLILRTLGAKKSYLKRILLAEFVLLGFSAGLVAVLGSELVALAVYTQVLDMQYGLHYWMWLAGPVSGVVLIISAGYLSTRKVIMQPPVKTLQEL